MILNHARVAKCWLWKWTMVHAITWFAQFVARNSAGYAWKRLVIYTIWGEQNSKRKHLNCVQAKSIYASPCSSPHKVPSTQICSFCYSPSGCTFWGKKPWSRKKKLLWQLGTLVGAPVGIALVAGIAVPAMIIGEIEIRNQLYNQTKEIIEMNFKSLKLQISYFHWSGIPVWIGRKLHTRYRLSGKHKRNFAVLGGVAASVSSSFRKKNPIFKTPWEP